MPVTRKQKLKSIRRDRMHARRYLDSGLAGLEEQWAAEERHLPTGPTTFGPCFVYAPYIPIEVALTLRSLPIVRMARKLRARWTLQGAWKRSARRKKLRGRAAKEANARVASYERAPFSETTVVRTWYDWHQSTAGRGVDI